MNRLSVDLDSLTPLGWREWISFPEWEIGFIKAKVDTGAKTSSLHAEDISIFEHRGVQMVTFTIYPWQNSTLDKKAVTTELVAFRKVRNSSGSMEKRPVIRTGINVAGYHINTELTLTNRELMGFRMLLGRRALDQNFLVITKKSYLGIKAPPNIRELNRGGAREI